MRIETNQYKWLLAVIQHNIHCKYNIIKMCIHYLVL